MGERSERRVLIDLGPLRRSRGLRCLVLGELASVLGTQLTTVAVPYQVYQLTRSSLAVGLVSLAQLFPLIAGALLGGSAVDAMDRRRPLMAALAAGLPAPAHARTRRGKRRKRNLTWRELLVTGASDTSNNAQGRA